MCDELRGRELWAHLRLLDLCRRLRADLDNLGDTSPRIAMAVPGAAAYLADLVSDPKAAAILRGPDVVSVDHATQHTRVVPLREVQP